MPKVSVIIPIYNVEPYLKKCLDSVCNQTLKDIEIICVNDCSPDNSLVIVNEYAQNDNRIKIIDFKQNQGVAIARNTALSQANGEYIGFVDPDDWIDLDFYENLYNRAVEKNLDLVIGNIKTFFNGLEIRSNLDFQIFKYEKVFYGLFQLGLYKRSLLKKYNIKFTEGCIIGEDRLLPIMFSYYAKKFDVLDNVYYNQLRRDNSATKNISARKIDDYIFSCLLVKDFVLGSKMSKDKVYIVLYNLWKGGINLLQFANYSSLSSLEQFLEKLYEVMEDKSIFSSLDIEIFDSLKFRDEDKMLQKLNLWQKKSVFDTIRSNNNIFCKQRMKND